MAAALEGRRVDGEEVAGHCRTRIDEAGERLLLIEGAGGVMSPLDETRTMLDLATALDAPAILVAGTYLGTISHTLTAHHALATAGVSVRAIVLSESDRSGPPLDETALALQRHLPKSPILVIGRNQDWQRRWLAVIGGQAADSI
jgi:dethiobiotin synthetase